MDKRTEFRNFVWNFVGISVNSFMSLVYQVIVTRINGLEATGVFSVCFSFSLLVFTFANLGGRVFEVADKDGNDNTYYTLKWVTAAVSLIFAMAFSMVSGYTREKCSLILVLILVRIIESFSDTIYAVWQKAERLDLVGMSYVIKNGAALVGFVVVDLITKDLLFATGAMLGATIAVYYAFDKLVSARFHKLRIDFSGSSCISLSKRISYFLGYNLVVMIIANMPKLIADLKYTESQMGYFGILMMIPTAMMLLGQMIIQPYLTRITEDYRSRNLRAVKNTVAGIFAGITGLALACCMAAYFLGAPVLGLVYGLDFEPYQFVMILSIVSGMFNVFVTVLSVVLTVMGRSRQQLYLYSFVMTVEAVILSFGLSSEAFYRAFAVYFWIMVIQFAVFAIYFYIVFRREKNEP